MHNLFTLHTRKSHSRLLPPAVRAADCGGCRRYRLALFGSGLQVGTGRPLVRGLLGGDGPFAPTGHFEAGQRGVGAGVGVRLADRFTLVVCVFYSNSRAIRERRLAGLPYYSILFQPQVSPRPLSLARQVVDMELPG